MIRQDATWLLMWGTCVGLFAGCASAQRHRHPCQPAGSELASAVERRAQPPAPGEEPRGAAASVAGGPPASPYHLQQPAPPVIAAESAQTKQEMTPTALAEPAADPEPSGQILPASIRPPPQDPPLLAALRYLMDQRSGEAVAQLLDHYDKSTQDLLLCLLPPLARVGQGNLDEAKPQEVAHLVDQLDSALLILRPRAALCIAQACFCRRIEGFGKYEPLPEDYPVRVGFRPGELVMLYVEPDHFSCLKTRAGHEIRLAGSLEIRDSTGAVKWKQEFAPQPDRSQGPRHDYFLSYRFYIPEPKADFPPGLYKLYVRVLDVAEATESADRDHRPRPERTAERSLDLRITTRPVQ